MVAQDIAGRMPSARVRRSRPPSWSTLGVSVPRHVRRVTPASAYGDSPVVSTAHGADRLVRAAAPATGGLSGAALGMPKDTRARTAPWLGAPSLRSLRAGVVRTVSRLTCVKRSTSGSTPGSQTGRDAERPLDPRAADRRRWPSTSSSSVSVTSARSCHRRRVPTYSCCHAGRSLRRTPAAARRRLTLLRLSPWWAASEAAVAPA
jgi:hypothetical protein